MRRRFLSDLLHSQYGVRRVKRGRELTIIIIITHNHLLDLAELAHFAPEVLVKGIEVVLQLASVHLVLRVVRWVLVEVWEQNCLAV